MALGAVQVVATTGLTPSYATPLSTEQIAYSDDQWLHVKNGSGGSINVTITDPGSTPAGSAATNPVIAVGAGAEKLIALNPGAAGGGYVSPSTGTIQVAFSATASITAAVIRI